MKPRLGLSLAIGIVLLACERSPEDPFIADPGLPGRVQDSVDRLQHPPTTELAFVDMAWISGVYDLVPAWGAAWNDFDGDGDADLFVANHMHYPSTLYVNEGGGFFHALPGPLGAELGRDDHGGSWSDFDGDGDEDLFTANGYYRPDHLMRNDGGGRFTDVSAQAGIRAELSGRGRSAVVGDFDGDGWSDIVVTNLRTPDRFFHNLGDGTFRETGREAGIDNPFLKEGAIAGDLDGDGDLDIYVCMPDVGRANLLYLNRGDGRFVERSAGSGADLLLPSRGCVMGDYDDDGDLDLFVPVESPEGYRILRNRGDGTFDDATERAGIWRAFEAYTFSRTFLRGEDRYIIYVRGWNEAVPPDREFERKTASKELERRLRDRFLDQILHGNPG